MSNLEKRDQVLKAARSCQSALVAYAYAMLTDYAAAEDVVQNALLVVARRHEDFEEGSSMLAWCRSIVRSEVLAHLSKRRRERPVEDRILTLWMRRSRRIRTPNPLAAWITCESASPGCRGVGVR